MEIERTTFGTITIDGKTYEHDEGPDRAEPNVRTDVSRADLPRVAFGSICDQAACPRLVRQRRLSPRPWER